MQQHIMLTAVKVRTVTMEPPHRQHGKMYGKYQRQPLAQVT